MFRWKGDEGEGRGREVSEKWNSYFQLEILQSLGGLYDGLAFTPSTGLTL